MNKELDRYFETNRQTWNDKVAVHTESDFYNLDGFINGETSLMKYELKALGDVSGKSLLHLQCHFGQDTLSWARMGAQCTGVDISDAGIAFAKALSEKTATPANFVCCNVLDTSQHISQTFDIVFTSYGTIGWLPDLKPWGKMIAERLNKGGTFYIADFHPLVWMFDYTSGKAVLKYGYNQDEVIYEEYQGTYADENAPIMSKEYGWNHGLGEVVTALTDAGLHIEFLREHDESPYDVLPDLVKNENGLYVTKDRLYPLLFEIKATKF
ncbi:class I SAM-dependent methyltransferase [Dokdonia sinensis]|uniref:Class I SAM-dependent methyltransferase n=1 Tax=Dokdonia sinensis TaxID=2479847 RepID=A0A3M0GH70_9FLAO|nr:class I SAM-dependent methyltransferase [Dokdonia sinensis]RMB63907.1 class I SAM-dependent methyltransferase [Dokdonia sinensis]